MERYKWLKEGCLELEKKLNAPLELFISSKLRHIGIYLTINIYQICIN